MLLRTLVLLSTLGRTHSRSVLTFSNVHMVNSPGCTLSGDTIIECDGTARAVDAEEKLALDVYNEVSKKWNDDLQRLLGQGDWSAEKVHFDLPDYPRFPNICKSCS